MREKRQILVGKKKCHSQLKMKSVCETTRNATLFLITKKKLEIPSSRLAVKRRHFGVARRLRDSSQRTHEYATDECATHKIKKNEKCCRLLFEFLLFKSKNYFLFLLFKKMKIKKWNGPIFVIGRSYPHSPLALLSVPKGRGVGDDEKREEEKEEKEGEFIWHFVPRIAFPTVFIM